VEIKVSSNLRSFPTDFFIESVKLKRDTNLESKQVSYLEIGLGDTETRVVEHWNGSHLRTNSKPSKWSEFHTEELIRCIMQKLPDIELRTSIIKQRTHLLQAILRNQWTQSTNIELDQEELNDGLRGRMLSMPGLVSIGGEKWNRITKPVYGRLNGNTEWAIILDARTTQEITDGIDGKHLRCYSNGLRLIALNEISEEHIICFSEYISEGQGNFLPENHILFWLNHAQSFNHVSGDTFARYSPFISIEGHRAFSHPLRGHSGSSRPLDKNGLCILTGNIAQPLSLLIGESEIELAMKFSEDHEGQERLHAVGFIKTSGADVEYLSIHPEQLNLGFTKDSGEEVSRTHKNVLKNDLTYNTLRDLTKSFRICAKKQCNPNHTFTDLSGIGISAYHSRWYRISKNTPLENAMREVILTVNGWN